jgi:molybdate transport system ATP-binding protein
VDKGKIPPNTPVAWVVPADGLSLHAQQSSSSIPAKVTDISSLGQIAVIQLTLHEGAHTVTWQASAAEIRRLALEVGVTTQIEIDSAKIHIMPLRQINDPRRFTT